VLYATQKNINGIRKHINMKMYRCHMCSEWMEPTDISPFMEWHICDMCTNKRYEYDE